MRFVRRHAPGLSASALAAVLATAGGARAQSAPGTVVPADIRVAALVSRAAPDDVTVRAVRLDAPLILDGRLDEPSYASVLPLTDFIQQEPQEGQPATEKTEAWIFFD